MPPTRLHAQDPYTVMEPKRVLCLAQPLMLTGFFLIWTGFDEQPGCDRAGCLGLTVMSRLGGGTATSPRPVDVY
jgi:hypothetical protein